MKKYCRICHRRFENSENLCPRCKVPLADDVKTPEQVVNCNFTYQCPLDWGKLDTTADEDTRFCQTCQKNVYLAHAQSQIDNLAREGKCVAIYPDSSLNIPRPSQPPPLMGVLVAPQESEEIEAENKQTAQEIENRFTQPNVKKLWWKFWQ